MSPKAPKVWYRMSAEWKWRDRAEAWETRQSELAMATVEAAARKIRMLSVQAVEALELQLLSDRYRHVAAKEILDRAGIPATTRIESENKVSITSDDMAKATEEAAEWERQQNKSESG